MFHRLRRQHKPVAELDRELRFGSRPLPRGCNARSASLFSNNVLKRDYETAEMLRLWQREYEPQSMCLESLAVGLPARPSLSCPLLFVASPNWTNALTPPVIRNPMRNVIKLLSALYRRATCRSVVTNVQCYSPRSMPCSSRGKN